MDTGEADTIPMTSANNRDSAGTGSSDDLRGLEILLVEDSWSVGEAMKDMLELLGADVIGPAATTAEAERLLLSEHAPLPTDWTVPVETRSVYQ
jgi:hypothetical protein